MLAARLVVLPVASNMLSRHSALVVIDAQRAFVDPEGSVARTYGIDDVQPGMAALGRLCRFIAEHRSKGGPTIFVRSEYRPGQFTDGQLDHGMANVCVLGINVEEFSLEHAPGMPVGLAEVSVLPAVRGALEEALVTRGWHVV